MGPKQRWIRTKDKIELINYRYGRERETTNEETLSRKPASTLIRDSSYPVLAIGRERSPVNLSALIRQNASKLRFDPDGDTRENLLCVPTIRGHHTRV